VSSARRTNSIAYSTRLLFDIVGTVCHRR
jgi:hypothetical protein